MYEDDYDGGLSFCRKCGGKADGAKVVAPCIRCRCEVETGQVRFECRCGHGWHVGSRTCHHLERLPLCPTCFSLPLGTCAVCRATAMPGNCHRTSNGLVCRACSSRPVTVWCPSCGTRFPNTGYLNAEFRDDAPALQAAALVTHYRHAHRRSYDRACSNRAYARTIPWYDHDEQKEIVNEQAKRQLVRAVAGHLKAGTYPQDAPVRPGPLVEAFRRLRNDDPETLALIDKTLAKLGGDAVHRID